MKALTVYEADKLRVEEVGLPRLPAGQTRIRVKYAGVGFADVMAVRGGYPLAPRRPFSPGYEFLGSVVEAGTSSLGVGQRVAGMLPRMGAYRELIDMDPRYAVRVPPDLSDECAALLPLNYLTALAMIERYARLERGQSFLIHGAAGGVGTAALELARLLGLRAFGSASEPKHGLSLPWAASLCAARARDGSKSSVRSRTTASTPPSMPSGPHHSGARGVRSLPREP